MTVGLKEDECVKGSDRKVWIQKKTCTYSSKSESPVVRLKLPGIDDGDGSSSTSRSSTLSWEEAEFPAPRFFFLLLVSSFEMPLTFSSGLSSVVDLDRDLSGVDSTERRPLLRELERLSWSTLSVWLRPEREKTFLNVEEDDWGDGSCTTRVSMTAVLYVPERVVTDFTRLIMRSGMNMRLFQLYCGG